MNLVNYFQLNKSRMSNIKAKRKEQENFLNAFLLNLYKVPDIKFSKSTLDNKIKLYIYQDRLATGCCEECSV
jgi:hypothetical protein